MNDVRSPVHNGVDLACGCDDSAFCLGEHTPTGFKLLAMWGGVSEAECEWIAARVRELITAGKSAAEATATVKAEAQAKPWLSPGVSTQK